MGRELSTNLYHMVHALDDPGLRKTGFARYLNASRDVGCTPEQVVLTSGIQEFDKSSPQTIRTSRKRMSICGWRTLDFPAREQWLKMRTSHWLMRRQTKKSRYSRSDHRHILRYAITSNADGDSSVSRFTHEASRISFANQCLSLKMITIAYIVLTACPFQHSSRWIVGEESFTWGRSQKRSRQACELAFSFFLTRSRKICQTVPDVPMHSFMVEPRNLTIIHKERPFRAPYSQNGQDGKGTSHCFSNCSKNKCLLLCNVLEPAQETAYVHACWQRNESRACGIRKRKRRCNRFHAKILA